MKRVRFFQVLLLSAVALLVWAWNNPAFTYPLDGYSDTGIARLEGYRQAQSGAVKGRRLYPGANLPTRAIRLRLQNHTGMGIPAPDPELNRALRGIVHGNYGVSLLDLSNPSRPRYAEVNGSQRLNPGSVGKIIALLGIFQTLADIYPGDTAARVSVLRNTQEVADGFIRNDSHTVPFWKPGDSRVLQRRIRQGDRANLWTFMDWMASSSSNAAASMVMKNLVLMQHYGRAYPRSTQEMNGFLRTAPKSLLRNLLVKGLQSPITRNGMSLANLRQGSLFTGAGKRRIPGTSSHSTPRELLKYMLLMEQGRLVDPFSSLQIKRLLYLTDRRIRYASSPALGNAAVYFKSGSLYGCRPEPGFTCKKYHGNVRNFMNSVAIVESINRNPPLYYITAVQSNVLRKNSAWAHRDMGTKIHRLIERFHGGPTSPTSYEMPGSGGGGGGGSGYGNADRSLEEEDDPRF